MRRFILLLAILLSVTPLRAQTIDKNRSAISVPEGYAVEMVAIGLSNPTAMRLDGEDLVVAESGTAISPSRVIKVSTSSAEVLVGAGLRSPVGAIAVYEGELYVAHGIYVSKVTQGVPVDLVVNHLSTSTPSHLTFDKEGRVHFDYKDQGPVTSNKLFGFEKDAFMTSSSSVNRIEAKSGKAFVFAANKSGGPAYTSTQGGFNTPTDLLFGPDGALFVLDRGIPSNIGFEIETGMVWRIYNTLTQKTQFVGGPVAVERPPLPVGKNPSWYKKVLEKMGELGNKISRLFR